MLTHLKKVNHHGKIITVGLMKTEKDWTSPTVDAKSKKLIQVMNLSKNVMVVYSDVFWHTKDFFVLLFLDTF